MKNWSEVDDATVRKHFDKEELSYGQIAALYEDATIGKVAGRCRRLGLKRGTSPTIGVKRAGRGGTVVPPPAPPPPPQKPAPKPRAKVAAMSVVAMRHETQKRPFVRGQVRLEDLESKQCKWPFGDPRDRDFGFCGDAREGESPYCCEHNKLAYNRSPSVKHGRRL